MQWNGHKLTQGLTHYRVKVIAVMAVAVISTDVLPAADRPAIAPGTRQCPLDQMPATRIDYEGNNILASGTDVNDRRPGYAKRTVIVADGYYKEITERTAILLKKKPRGQHEMTHLTMELLEHPSRSVIIETPLQRLEYEDRSDDANHMGVRTNKVEQMSGGSQSAAVIDAQTTLPMLLEPLPSIDKATYAGISCDLRWAPSPGKILCIAKIRGRHVTIAEDMQGSPNGRSWMLAKSKADICVSTEDFVPPAHARVQQAR